MSSTSARPLRRSTRLSKANVSYPVVTDSAPPPKRRRTDKATVVESSGLSSPLRGRNKLLSMLPNMPLDILYEIFSHLLPYDLLHLARSTKALRGVLMHRSAITVWRRARENRPDIPDCPPDLTEPAFANLLFDPHCHFCVKARVIRGMWVNRVRCCKKCLQEHFSFDIPCAPPLAQLQDPGALALLPEDLIDDKLYHSQAELLRLRDRIAQCNGDAVALKLLRKQQIKYVRMRQNTGSELKAWYIIDNEKRRDEKNALRVRRGEQIINRLRQLGYDIEYLSTPLLEKFCKHPLVQQPKEITDRIWKNIKESMVEFAEEASADLRMRNHCAHYSTRLDLIQKLTKGFVSSQPLWMTTPSIADLSWHAPKFRQFLEHGALLLVGQLGFITLLYTCNKARELYAMIPKVTLYPPTSENEGRGNAGDTRKTAQSEQEQLSTFSPSILEVTRALRSPTCWFRCTVKGCLLDYPRVLSHHCAKTGPPITVEPKTDMDDLQNAYNIVLGEFPWNFTGNKIVYDPEARRAAEKVVRAASVNMSATVEDFSRIEVDVLNKRFVCGQCSTDGKVCVMSWKVAVRHLLQPSHIGRDVKITALNDEDRTRVLVQELTRLRDKFDCTYKIWGCVRCRSLEAMTMVQVVGHCILEHDIADPTEEDDYDTHPDAETTPEVPADEQHYPEEHFTTTILR